MGNETTNVGVIVGKATSADSTERGRTLFVWDPSSCVRYFQARWVLRQLAFADALSPQEATQAHIEVAADID